MKSCVNNYYKLAELIRTSTLNKVMDKFASKSFKEVSTIINSVIERQKKEHEKQKLELHRAKQM